MARKASKLVTDIFSTQAAEIQCADSADIIVRCANQQLSRDQIAASYPALAQHLRVCADCSAEYTVLSEQMALFAANQQQMPASIPRRPQSKPAQPASNTQTIPGFALAKALGVMRGEQRVFEPQTIPLQAPLTAVELNLMVSRDKPNLYDLLCTFSAESSAQQPNSPDLFLTGTELVLTHTTDSNVLYTDTIDDNFDAAFTHLAAGTYKLEWQCAGQTYIINSIVIDE